MELISTQTASTFVLISNLDYLIILFAIALKEHTTRDHLLFMSQQHQNIL